MKYERLETSIKKDCNVKPDKASKKMKKFLFLMPLVFVSCYNVERNCADFKTGEFKFDYVVDGVQKTTTFVRTGDIEIDYYEGKVDTSSIRWINDCEYIVQKLHPKNMEEKKAIAMKIVSTTKDSYIFEFGIVGSENKQRGTVVKVK